MKRLKHHLRRLSLYQSFWQCIFTREIVTTHSVNLYQLYIYLIADIYNIGNLFNTLVIKLAYMNKAFLAGKILNKRTEAMPRTIFIARLAASASVVEKNTVPSSSISIFTPVSATIF